MSVINKYNFYINSKQRVSGEPNNFKIILQKPVIRTAENSYFEFFISSLNFPFSYKQINNNNNTFQIKLNANLPITVTIPSGNYNILTLSSTILQEINNALGGIYNISYSYNKDTSFVTFTYNTNDANVFILYFANNGLGECLGFVNNITLSFGNPQTSTQSVNVNPAQFFCIRSNTINQGNNNLESLDKSSEKSNILAKVPIKSASNTFIYWSQPYESRVISNIELFQELDFEVTAGGKGKDIQGQLDFSFTLVCQEILKPDYKAFTKFNEIIGSNIDVNELENQKQQLLNELMNEKNKLLKTT